MTEVFFAVPIGLVTLATFAGYVATISTLEKPRRKITPREGIRTLYFSLLVSAFYADVTMVYWNITEIRIVGGFLIGIYQLNVLIMLGEVDRPPRQLTSNEKIQKGVASSLLTSALVTLFVLVLLAGR